MTRRVLPAMAFALAFVLAGGEASGKPRRGDKELRLGTANALFVVGPAVPPGLTRQEASGGGGTTGFGAELGLLGFPRDWFAIGGEMLVAYASAGGRNDFLFGFAPIMRLLMVPRSVGFYLEASPGLLVQKRIDTHPVFRLGTGLGMEAFPTEWWAVRFGPTYELYLNKDGGQAVHVLGVGWGIAAYF
jgi:hypothetical protein